MKRWYIVVIVTLLLGMSGCEGEELLDYSDFEDVRQLSYDAGETKENERYILYYYSENCGHCSDVKQEILTFFQTFDHLNVYLLDTGAEEVKDVSRYDEFVGTPSLFIIADGEVIESYVGSQEIRSFIESYRGFELDMSVFSPQQVQDGNDLLDLDRTVLVYYYDDACIDCDDTHALFMPFAYKRGPKDVYFMNHQDVINIPQGFLSLGEGPVLLKMTGGVIEATYQANDIEQYINELDNNVLRTEYDYESFAEQHLIDYDDLLTIDETLYVVYYYSPVCAYCNAIKNDVLALFDSFELPYYLFDTSVTTGTVPTDLQGVPTLRLVINGQVETEYIGTLEISDFIQSYQDGTLNFNEYID